MKDLFRAALQWLADTRLARGVVDTLFRGRARRRVAELDTQSVARSQNRTLLGLVHKAHTTHFGRDHEFRRIRTAGDFQRLVPLRTPAELWRDYWQPAYPNLGGATWPGPIPYLAISSVQQNGPFPYVPVSPALWAAQQTAVLTALAFVMHARPRTRLCSGRLFLLGGGTTLTPLAASGQAETLEAMAIRELPPLLQPYAFTLPRLDVRTEGPNDERFLQVLAERSAALPVSCLAGTADRLERLFRHVKRATGRERIADIWPHLAAALYARGSAENQRAQLVDELGGSGACLLEMYFRPEGAVAVEDPRHGGLRLLSDHGVYFEFVPVDQLGKLQPARYSAAEVKLGVPYALALSSPAGIWACLVGSVVRFERRDPPLLRLVETELLWERPAPPAPAVKKPAPLRLSPLQGPHPRSAGTAAGHPGTPFHIAWSARGDRG
jgi:hypothetical protein